MSEALHLFNAGGLVMYPLLLCSILVITKKQNQTSRN